MSFGGLQAAGPIWRWASFGIAIGVLAPVLMLAWLAFGSGVAHWGPLFAHVLPQAALNTALLLTGVGALVLLIGTGCAWLVTACDFPGRRVLNWALLLPLAMPTYIVALPGPAASDRPGAGCDPLGAGLRQPAPVPPA